MKSDNVERILAAIQALSEEDRADLFHRLDDLRPGPSQDTLPLDFSVPDMEGPADYVLIFDGGSRGNPGPGYGSYALVRASDEKQRLVRLDFDREMTNNEAEYEALIAGLQGLIERVEHAGRSPDEFTVEVRGDSALVLRQVEGVWKAKDDRMRYLRNRARNSLAQFKAYDLVLQGREESVRVLGH